MPPNLGGFFMVRSYYPSECHADYFVFVHIDDLITCFYYFCFFFFFYFLFSCLQIFDSFLWFVLITLLNVTLIILTLSVSMLLNLLLRLVAFLLFLNPQCLASISRWITASSSWKRFCLFVCRALSSIMVICMLTAIRLLLTFVMSLYLLLRS